VGGREKGKRQTKAKNIDFFAGQWQENKRKRERESGTESIWRESYITRNMVFFAATTTAVAIKYGLYYAY
jgi:hypothetical protein